MRKSSKNWFWNIVIVLTILVSIAAFVLHYKNWLKFEEGHFQVVSGIYKEKIVLSDINSVGFVEKLPQMERTSGFSWLAREKGVFKDSITASKVYVFVDDLRQQKIRLVYKDSLKLYINFSDSLQTNRVYENIKEAIDGDE